MSSLWKESITLTTAVILLPFLITSTIIPAIRQLMRLKIPDDDRFVVSHQNNGRNKEINRGAGSGTFVLGPSSQEGLSSDISNPRVLSDMGLAIPRPTRLGDPRSVCASLSNIILTSLLTIFSFSSLTKSTESLQNSVRYPCSTNNDSSSLAVRSIFLLKSALYGINILITELSLSS
jgi:hypothetical protein